MLDTAECNSHGARMLRQARANSQEQATKGVGRAASRSALEPLSEAGARKARRGFTIGACRGVISPHLIWARGIWVISCDLLHLLYISMLWP